MVQEREVTGCRMLKGGARERSQKRRMDERVQGRQRDINGITVGIKESYSWKENCNEARSKT